MDGEEENCHYNVQLVSVVYNNELKEHLDELAELKNTLADDGKAYSETTRCRYLKITFQNVFFFSGP